jgi:hypothetical protein
LPPNAATPYEAIMQWHVQYRSAGAEYVIVHSSPQAAIEIGHGLIGAGIDVFDIGKEATPGPIAGELIGRGYAEWV